MMNKKLIEDTVGLVVDFFVAENIYENTNTIINRAKNWYNHTEVTDPETLAALTIYGNYEPNLTYNDILNIKEFFFPSVPIEYNNFSISEIKAAIDDEMWRR